MSNRNEVLRKRYHVYRALGYDSRTSRALSQRSLDVSGIELSKRTGRLKRNKTTKQYLNVEMERWQRRDVIDRYHDRIKPIVNETVDNDTDYTPYGLLTHDKRYRGENGKIISIIKNENRLTTDQAYYFFYYMTQSGQDYETTKKELLSAKDFEEYEARKRQRQYERKSKRRRR